MRPCATVLFTAATLSLVGGAATATGTAMHDAAAGHDPDRVRALLDAGHAVNVPDRAYRTPLHVAARQGHLAVLALLLDRGADAGAPDQDGNTPLHATFYNRPAAVALLLEHGADVNAQNRIGHTVLHNSVFFPSVVETLLAHGADVHLANRLGLSPLDIAAMAGRTGVAARLLDAGGDRTDALFAAVHQGQASMVGALLEKGADVHARNLEDHTLLHRALMAREPSIEVVDILIAAGADVHAVAERAPRAYGSVHVLSQQRPLHLAVRAGIAPLALELSTRLIAAGADVNAVDAHGMTPFLYALRRGAHFRRLYPEYPALVRLMIESGADLKREYPGGRTPLHYAAGLVSAHFTAGSRGTHAIIEVLIAAGLDVNARDDQGRSPLHEAARIRQSGHHWGRRRLNAAALIENGADVQARDHAGRTPLHVAAQAGCERNALLLLESGAGTDIQDADGDTALDLAVALDQSAVRTVLTDPRWMRP